MAAMILPQSTHDLRGRSGIRKGHKPPQVTEHHRDLAPMALQQMRSAGGHQELGQAGREEVFQAPRTLQRRQLLGQALLKRVVRLRQVRRLRFQA